MRPNFSPFIHSDFTPCTSPNSRISQNSLQNIQYLRSLAHQKHEDHNKSSIPPGTEQMIPYHLKLMWKQELVERRVLKGAIRYKQNMSISEIQRAIQRDISDSSIKLRETANMYIKLAKEQRVIVQIMRNGQQTRQIYTINQQRIEGVLIESKINLPKQYSHLPDKFEGFTIPKLSIFNSFGRVDWQTPVNIDNVDFSKGLELDRESFTCAIPALQTQVVITFNNLPYKIERMFANGETQGLFIKLKRSIEEKDKNCKVLWLDVASSTWMISVSFNTENDLK